MLNVLEQDKSIKIKGSKFMYGWLFLATIGGVAACFFLIVNGFKFDSKYSLLYLGGGFICIPFFLYLTLWSLPGFIPGKVLLIIVQGEKGKVLAKKGYADLSNIRDINLVRNPLNLINDIVIETFDDIVIKIRTYNLIDDLDFQVMVDQYIFPYMTEDARKVWDRKVDLSVLRKEVRYERQDQRVD